MVEGVIARRMLINYRVRHELIAALLPSPFRPKRIGGWAMAGLCLIRLESLRIKGLPAAFGLSSENIAHRVAVEFDEEAGVREGVFVLRRDTSSKWNALAGGRVFPGVHRLAEFRNWESDNRFKVEARTGACGKLVRVAARTSKRWTNESVFGSLEEASEFYRRGACGWSANRAGHCEGLELRVHDWVAEPLVVEHLESEFFDDRTRFPAGTVEFDCALLMRNIRHEWRTVPSPRKALEVA
jgi:hypothetical protein